MHRFKTALVLGGGGARGISSLGVLKVLDEHNIKPDFILGTSMGAIIGSLYVILGSFEKVKERLEYIVNSKEFNKLKTDFIVKRSLIKKDLPNQKTIKDRFVDLVWHTYIHGVGNTKISFFDEETISSVIDLLIPDVKIEDLPLPFFPVVLNLIKGESEVVRLGSLRKAVRASAAIPGVFAPVIINNDVYVDGGVVAAVPAKEAKMLDADFVIAVDVRSKKHGLQNLKNANDVIVRGNYIARYLINDLKAGCADILLQPEVSDIHWADFKQYDFLINKGEDIARSKICDIKNAMRKKRIKAFFGF